MDQWQKLTPQQRAIAVGAVAVIVFCLAAALWITLRRPAPRPDVPTVGQTTTSGMTGLEAPTGSPGGMVGEGMPTTPGGLPAGAPPTMMGQSGAPMVGATGALGQPTTGIETAPTPPVMTGKLEKPPSPGRDDPFAPIEFFNPPPFPSPSVPPFPVSEGREREALSDFRWEQQISSLPQLQAPPSVSFSGYRTQPTERRQGREVEDPTLRVAGIMISDRINALLELPDGRTVVASPGRTVGIGGVFYTVVRIESDKVVLRNDAGEERIAVRRPGRVRVAPPTGGVSQPGAPMMPGGMMPGGGYGGGGLGF